MLSEIIVNTDLVHNKNLSTEAETASQQWTHCEKFQVAKKKKDSFFFIHFRTNEWLVPMQVFASTFFNDAKRYW